jgi:phage FluMu protein gp41
VKLQENISLRLHIIIEYVHLNFQMLSVRLGTHNGRVCVIADQSTFDMTLLHHKTQMVGNAEARV